MCAAAPPSDDVAESGVVLVESPSSVPGSADDVMLGYQSTSFHDALYVRKVLGKRPAPEFEEWLDRVGLLAADGGVLQIDPASSPLRAITGVAA